MNFTVGQLVEYRNRQWIVQPSPRGEEDILLLQPLGGAEIEQVGIYTPFNKQLEKVKKANFEPPKLHHPIGDLTTAKLLFEANRLSFRQASGPFRAMAKLGFRPRAYQLVPLLLALQQVETEEQNPLRLLIADDVGIGKTIEALLIMTELLERRIVNRVAVLCPPHLCDQWQQEILSKTGKQAVIVRSSTINQLENKLPAGKSIWQHYPLTVVSLDFAKDPKRRELFVAFAPDLVVVDEVHTCAKPASQRDNVKQLRHEFLAKLMSEKTEQHLLMLTATPHSGKEEEFKSVLGLLNPNFEDLDLNKPADQKKLAPHFVQRKRLDLLPWLNNPKDKFPTRKSKSEEYNIGKGGVYKEFYEGLFSFTADVARQVNQEGELKGKNRMRFWAALSLMRGALSSPKAAEKMIGRRLNEILVKESIAETEIENISYVNYTDGSDQEELGLNYHEQISSNEEDALRNLLTLTAEINKSADELQPYGQGKNTLKGPSLLDPKLATLIEIIGIDDKRSNSLELRPMRPIVFCTYIATANYVGDILKKAFPKKEIVTVTSELADLDRKQQIEGIDSEKDYILVATDCLSEGINLQDKFDTVIHYDLPWNPNRLEQREGRVDRFGQEADEVKIFKIYSTDNLVDKRITKILNEKIQAINSTIGSGMAVFDLEKNLQDQFWLDFLNLDDEVQEGQTTLFEKTLDEQLKELTAAGQKIKAIYSHNKNLEPEDLKQEIAAIDTSIGTQDSVAELVYNGLNFMGFQVEWVKMGPKLAEHLKITLTNSHKKYFDVVYYELKALAQQYKLKNEVLKVSFESPTPAGLIYLGRNAAVVTTICQVLVKLAINPLEEVQSLRVAALRTHAVDSLTTIVMMRMRNVIGRKQVKRGAKTKNQSEPTTGDEQLKFVAEEMYLGGWKGSPDAESTPVWLSDQEANQLLFGLKQIDSAPANVQLANARLSDALSFIATPTFSNHCDALAKERAALLAESHDRIGKNQGMRFSEALYPVIPPDVMGVYVLIPITKL